MVYNAFGPLTAIWWSWFYCFCYAWLSMLSTVLGWVCVDATSRSDVVHSTLQAWRGSWIVFFHSCRRSSDINRCRTRPLPHVRICLSQMKVILRISVFCYLPTKTLPPDCTAPADVHDPSAVVGVFVNSVFACMHISLKTYWLYILIYRWWWCK